MGGRVNGFVYFIAAETVGAVKIGFSRHHPRARLKHLQIGCPVPLKLLGFVDGDVEQEAHLHGMFVDLAIHGEWFRLEEPLVDMISGLRRRGVPKPVIPPRCPRCGEMEHAGRNNLIKHQGDFKICRGQPLEEVAK
jgi:hypothetical protein